MNSKTKQNSNKQNLAMIIAILLIIAGLLIAKNLPLKKDIQNTVGRGVAISSYGGQIEGGQPTNNQHTQLNN